MSRIGIKPIELPNEVQFNVDENNIVTVKGPKGELTEAIDRNIKINVEDNTVVLERPNESKKYKSLHGLYRSLIANMVEGVVKGYEKKLVLVGVGYRATKQGNKLVLNLGHSHPVEMEDPEGITTETPSQTEIIVKGINKQAVGNYAAKIRELRKPEPYKGKGVKYVDENIRRKEGKTGS
ncbi:MAG: 50S ribosomal protein L6 [Clostridiales bacterium]|nr:50S ribosomal protein L6 [Clostridiales bacterium]